MLLRNNPLKVTSFKDANVVIALGTTSERIDPVRYMTTTGRSGEAGYQLAVALAKQGAKVKVIMGEAEFNNQGPVENLEIIKIKDVTAGKMRDVVLKEVGNADIFIDSSTIPTFSPLETKMEKIKKINQDAKAFTEFKVKKNNSLASTVMTTVTNTPVVLSMPEADIAEFARNKLHEEKITELSSVTANDNIIHAITKFKAQITVVSETKEVPANEATIPLTLKDKKAVVTSGPTCEFFPDGVNYMTNDSSGQMGYEIAAALAKKGAEVTLISGPTKLPCPQHVKRINVRTALEMQKAAKEEVEKTTTDIFFGVAAVADFRPHEIKETSDGNYAVTFQENPDVIASIGKLTKPPHVRVGFAAETDANKIAEYAKRKLEGKNLFAICANLVGNGLGFNAKMNKVSITFKDKNEQYVTVEIPSAEKSKLAMRIVETVCSRASHEGLIHESLRMKKPLVIN